MTSTQEVSYVTSEELDKRFADLKSTLVQQILSSLGSQSSPVSSGPLPESKDFSPRSPTTPLSSSAVDEPPRRASTTPLSPPPSAKPPQLSAGLRNMVNTWQRILENRPVNPDCWGRALAYSQTPEGLESIKGLVNFSQEKLETYRKYSATGPKRK
jgi:hypothetical protein